MMPGWKQTYYTSKKFTTSKVSESGLSCAGYKTFIHFTPFENIHGIRACVSRAHIDILLDSSQLLKNA